MSQLCVKNQYYSGQGSLSLGLKDPNTGEIMEGLRPVGNVSALTLGITTEQFEHTESCSGARGVDFSLNTEVNVSVGITMESLNRENLALVTNGSSAVTLPGSVTDEAIIAGAVNNFVPLKNISVSNVIVSDSAGTPLSEDVDYTFDERSGMVCVLPGGAITSGDDLLVDYDFGSYDNIQGFTGGANPVRWARFAGLNTADEDKAVVVDIFSLSIAPLAELALINDELAQMAVEATALSDSTRVAPSSNFFQVLKAI